MTTQIQEEMIAALIQNYRFKRTIESRLPTIDFVYPDYTGNGNTEAFRFSETLRRELKERADIVREDLKDKSLLWTPNEAVLLEVGKYFPRLGLDEQISGKINSIYTYSPILFVGFGENDFASYVVKPVVDKSMSWFELSAHEKMIQELCLKEWLKKNHIGLLFKEF